MGKKWKKLWLLKKSKKQDKPQEAPEVLKKQPEELPKAPEPVVEDKPALEPEKAQEEKVCPTCKEDCGCESSEECVEKECGKKDKPSKKPAKVNKPAKKKAVKK